MLPSSIQTPDGSIYEIVSEPSVQPPVLYYLLGDENLAKYKYQSRTSPDNNWIGVGPQTPSVQKFEKTAVTPGNVWQVDISPLNGAIQKLNNYNVKAINYLYSKSTALFNNAGYPKQENLTMELNLLKPLEIVGNFLKFETIKPSTDVSGMTRASHPWFVHRFDIVCWNDSHIPKTYHKPNTPQGIIYYYLVTNEGYGYIPLSWVGVA